MYIPRESEQDSNDPVGEHPVGEDKLQEDAAPAPSALGTPAAYPMIQPMKAAFYFDSVEGFGQWRILISTRADRNLRETKKKDPVLFKIILKKIKSVRVLYESSDYSCSNYRELSNGQFSYDNQKRLAGSDMEVPVFEAKMTGDTRLVVRAQFMSATQSSECPAVYRRLCARV